MQPYFDTPLDPAVLERWQVAPQETVRNLQMGGEAIITQKEPVDEVFDLRLVIAPNGFGSTDFFSLQTQELLQPVRDAYRNSHDGKWPKENTELLPYAQTPEQLAAVEKLILRDSLAR